MADRLRSATSPYLLQHVDNPVDWWQWGEQAFAEARQRNVPVFLSVGYAACHWCHVMAHESFEDPSIADYLNDHFVSIKVDREERPDVDAVYMTATQAMTGQGGWPMSCFLTPNGDAFHCGTYYPPSPGRGMPSFRQLLEAVVQAWTSRRDEVVQVANQVTEELAKATASLPESDVDATVLDDARRVLAREFDTDNGGFGSAPKFPPSMVLEFLQRGGDRHSMSIVDTTLDKMSRGGIYDQLAGGFSRYSVDSSWVVPHFEKMLYDNALLLRVYAHSANRSTHFTSVMESTVEFMLSDLLTDEGAFAAALDADTDGVEGATYVWTPTQLREVLGDDDGAWAARLLQVSDAGSFEHGSSTLRMPYDPEDDDRWRRVRQRLLTARAQRRQPARDDKIVTEWNGLAITALAEAGVRSDRAHWVHVAAAVADFLLRVHLVDGRLRRTSRQGRAGTAAGVLADYGCLAQGLLALHQAGADPRWLREACGLLDTAIDLFADEPGVWFDTARDAEKLVTRPFDPTDNASPSGASAITNALLTASVLADHDRTVRYRQYADASLRRAATLMRRAPRFAGHWLAAADAALAGPVQVAIVGDSPSLLRAALTHAPPGTVVMSAFHGHPSVPLLAGRTQLDGRATAYVCRGYVCQRPVTDPESLIDQLNSA